MAQSLLGRWRSPYSVDGVSPYSVDGEMCQERASRRVKAGVRAASKQRVRRSEQAARASVRQRASGLLTSINLGIVERRRVRRCTRRVYKRAVYGSECGMHDCRAIADRLDASCTDSNVYVLNLRLELSLAVAVLFVIDQRTVYVCKYFPGKIKQFLQIEK